MMMMTSKEDTLQVTAQRRQALELALSSILTVCFLKRLIVLNLKQRNETAQTICFW